MKKTIIGSLGAAAVAFALQFTPAHVEASYFGACDPCGDVAWANPCDPCGVFDGCGPIGTKAGKWFLNGHIEAGFYANSKGRTSQYGGDEAVASLGRGAVDNSGNTIRLQNTRLTGAQINQVYLSMGRKVDGRHGWDLGGTVDFTWGSDAFVVQAGGMEYFPAVGDEGAAKRWGSGDYFSAFAQAYAELEYRSLNIKAGKFLAPFGLDSYKSTDNFFYSWSAASTMVPHTAGGMYATYNAGKTVDLIGGWVMADEFGLSSDHNYYLGGIFWRPARYKSIDMSYIFAIGENNTLGDASYDAYVHTLKINRQISKKLRTTFTWSLLNHNQLSDGANTLAVWCTAGETIYQYNDQWAFGYRTSTYRDERADLYWYGITLGANWTPNRWLVVKPEIRYDWLDGGVDPEEGSPIVRFGDSNYQFSGGLSAVVKF